MNSDLEDKKYFPIIAQLIRIFPTILFSIAISLGGTAVTVFIAQQTNNPIWKLAKDPAQVIEFPPYIGLLSNWAALLWMSTSVICIFASMVLKSNNASFRTYRFLFFSGILSFILVIDDMFLLHDEILPNLLDTRERYFYLGYILVLGIYIFYFWQDIGKYDYLLLIAAFLLFGMSRGLFLRFLNDYKTTNDMLKYFGIVFWLAFFYRAAKQEISLLIPKS